MFQDIFEFDPFVNPYGFGNQFHNNLSFFHIWSCNMHIFYNHYGAADLCKPWINISIFLPDFFFVEGSTTSITMRLITSITVSLLKIL